MNTLLAQVAPAANALSGQGWRQAGELGAAALLSAVIGLERELRQKDAGLRTHTLVGVGAALFVLISKYGFTDVLERNLVVLDPSRMAAQIVSGIGFLGAGLIFVRRDSVRGLTTAAAVWLTAGVGAAAGAGLLVLAALTTGLYLVVTFMAPVLRRRLPLSPPGTSVLHVRYPDGHGVLRNVLNEATRQGFVIDQVSAEPAEGPGAAGRPDAGRPDADRSVASRPDAAEAAEGRHAMVTVTMHVHGKRPVSELAGALTDLALVEAVVATDHRASDD